MQIRIVLNCILEIHVFPNAKRLRDLYSTFTGAGTTHKSSFAHTGKDLMCLRKASNAYFTKAMTLRNFVWSIVANEVIAGT